MPETVQLPAGGETVDVTDTDLFTIAQETSDNGSATYREVKDVTAIGVSDNSKFRVKVTPTKDSIYSGTESLYVYYEFKAASLKGATVYEVAEDPTNVSDTTFEYRGSNGYSFGNNYDTTGAQAYLNLSFDGKALSSGGADAQWGAQDVLDGSGNSIASKTGGKIVEPGSYMLVAYGKGSVYSDEEARFQVTVAKLDLTKANIVLDTTNPAQATIKTINGAPYSGNLDGDVKIERTDFDQGGNDSDTGTYTYTISAIDDGNVTGSQVVTVDKAEKPAYSAYDNQAWNVAFKDNEKSIDYSAGDDPFDISEIEVREGEGEKRLAEDEYTVKVHDAKTNAEVDAASVTTTGTWKVVVKVNAAETDYEFGGEASVVLTVKAGVIVQSSDIYVTYDGEAFDGGDPFTYDGTDFAAGFGVRVAVDIDGDETILTEGEDYTVGIQKKDAEGEWADVEQVIDAGSYRLVIKGVNYVITGGEATNTDYVEFTVDPCPVTKIRFAEAGVVPGSPLDDTTTEEVNEKEINIPVELPYTGEAIAPAFEYCVNADETNPAKQVWKALPADAYTLEFADDEGEEIDSLTALGTYTVTVKDAAKTDNYALAVANSYAESNTFDVVVTDEGVYADVPNTGEWYVDYVYDASAEGYMGGYKGTALFGPHNNLLRGEAATVLFRMAGGDENDPAYDDLFGDASEIFGDVDAMLYYNTPIAWVYQTGVITGYEDGTNEFRPDNSITREEFCTMLYRYAERTGQLGDEAEADLSAYPDAGSVSWWAQDAVEWAVANGIFGGDVTLRPNDSISRAEVAKMIVTLQPEQLENQFVK